MQHHQGPGPEKNEPQPSQDGSPNLGNAELKLRGIPANSPAQALAIAEYQDSQARALRAARIEACERAERAAAIIDGGERTTPANPSSSAPEETHPAIDRVDELLQQIEKLQKSGGGEIIIHPASPDDTYGIDISSEPHTLRFFGNSNRQELLRKAMHLADYDAALIEVSDKTSNLDHKYNLVFSEIPPGVIQSLEDLKIIADNHALSGTASEEEWLSAVFAFFGSLPESSTLKPKQQRHIEEICEELLRDPDSRRPEIAALAEYHITQIGAYQPTLQAVMNDNERQHMMLARDMFFELTGLKWQSVINAEHLLSLARSNGNIEQVLVCFCTAISPERGVSAYSSVLKPLFTSSIPELNEEALLSVALSFKKAQRLLKNFSDLKLRLTSTPDYDPDNF